ncbi:MAG TPA: hypothetical protein VFA71_11735 [Terriglobales bacterium]|nr:hypothetical protein [Terriglobales bacterium]
MQTLGVSDSTPQSENWLKSLFWPSIQSDVDYLGAQGYWVWNRPMVAVKSTRTQPL